MVTSRRRSSCPWARSATVKGITNAQLRGPARPGRPRQHLPPVPAPRRRTWSAEAGGHPRASCTTISPMLTDSRRLPGVQRSPTRSKLDDDGVHVPLHRTTAPSIRWTPEDNMRVQEAIGADIIMQLDQCTHYPATKEEVAARPWSCQRQLGAPLPGGAHARGPGAVRHRAGWRASRICVSRAPQRVEAKPAAACRRLWHRRLFRGRGSRAHARDSWAWSRPRCRRTSRATSWAWATPRPSCARWRWASTCSIACCPPARRAWARRFRVRDA